MELKSYRLNNGTTEEEVISDMTPQPHEDNMKTQISFADEPVVKFTDVSIGFFRNQMFERLNISVPNGKIYSILGPKNCGKTLILQCITGLVKPTKGQIQVFDANPAFSSFVGYMPQELSLSADLTVEETISYFANLYDLPDDLVRHKMEYLYDSIEVTKRNTLVRSLSNNDKVVLSLAIAVIHSPKLLILDEPTLYCDPFLKKAIWKQLRGLNAVENVTIIVSTSHIEEAKHADVVGFIRNGKLREEELPKHWPKELSMNTIEELFINVFTQKGKSEIPSLSATIENNNRMPVKHSISFDEISLSPNPNQYSPICASTTDRISTLYYKNIKREIRNIPLLIFQVLFPALAVTMFCACIGHNPYDIPIGVYNPDKPSFVSDLILKSFNPKTIQLQYYDSFDSAYEAVRQHQVWGILVFPHNYTRSMIERSSQGCEAAEEPEVDVEDETVEESVVHSRHISVDDKRDNETKLEPNLKSNSSELEVEEVAESGEKSKELEEKPYDSEDYETVDEPKPKLFTTIDLYMDNTNLLMSGAIKAQVIHALKKAKNKSDSNSNSNSGNSYAPPLQIMDPNVYGSSDVEMSEFITPGIIIAIVFLSSLLFPGLIIINERKSRELERSAMAGVKVYETILAHLMIQVIKLIAQITLILFSIFMIFDFPLIGSLYLVFLLVFVQGITGLVSSIAIASFCRNEIQALVLGLTLFSGVVVLGGIFWPIECMPRSAIFVSQFLPQSIAGNGLRSVLSRGWDLSYATVRMSLIVPFVWIIVLFFASILMFRIRK